MVALVCQPAGAANFWWDTTTAGLWSTSANWWTSAGGTTNGGPPGVNDIATMNGDGVNGTTVMQFDAATSLGGVGGLGFVNTGSTRIESSSTTSQALTLGSSGITVAAAEASGQGRRDSGAGGRYPSELCGRHVL